MNFLLAHPLKTYQRKLYCLIFIILLVGANKNLFAQQARQTLLFNDGWKFHSGETTGANEIAFKDADWRAVTLPHDWSIEGPYDEKWASATAYLPGGIGWYRKTFTIASGLRKKNLFLYFDGVYKNSEVWVNGHYLGKRPNGFVPFQYEITKYINASGTNVIAVKADHTEFADSRWYTGSGIYRNVYLVSTEPVHIDLWGVKFTTPQVQSSKAMANVAVTLMNESAAQSPIIVKANLVNSKGATVATAQQSVQIKSNDKANANLSFSVSNPMLWSVDDPQLYKLQVAVTTNGKSMDEVVQKVGFRSVRFDKDKGFFLNGTNMKLKGICLHDDAGALGVAVPEEVWIRRLVKLKEAGCNSIRMSHNPHADYFYNLCDSLGFLVMDEAFDEWELGKNKWIKGWNVGQPGKDGYHSSFTEWSANDVKDMVLRSINHPSIFMWSIGNEIDYPNDPYTHEILNTGRNPQIYGRGFTAGYPSASQLTPLAKQLVADVKKYDTTRPITAALAGVVMSNEVGYPEALDIVGYNYQEYRYADDHAKYPNRIIYGSENGHAASAWEAVAANDYIAGQYLWTGIDYMGEARSWPSKSNSAGLLDLAGFPKSEFYFRQSLWTDKPMIFIGTNAIKANRVDRRNLLPAWNYTAGDSVRITCYTNCDEAELMLNGNSLGKKLLADTRDKAIVWNIVFQPGQLMIKGYKNGKEMAQQLIETAAEPYIIKAETDQSNFAKGTRKLAQVAITVTDKTGKPVYNADNEITVSVSGPAKLLALESGNPSSHESATANHWKLYNGKLMAYVQASGTPGPFTITISSPGLQQKIIQLKSD